MVLVAQEDASVSLTPESRLAIEKLGSTLIHDVVWRSNWAFVGQVGISSVSPYEAMREVVDEWALPVAVSQCVPYRVDEESVMTELRREFCDQYDTYGEFCKRSWVKPQPLPVETQLVVSSLPVVIISRDRGPYLQQTLSSLFRAPGINPQNVIVFQDGYSSEIFTVVQQFGLRLVRFPKASSKLLNIANSKEADFITTNYRRMFDVIWGVNPKKCLFADKDFIIVLEDDLIVAPDIFDYFEQLIPVLRSDKSLFAASVWNANTHSSSLPHDPTVVYRTESFPGRGWVLSQDSWRDVLEPAWPKCCHGISWDVELRKVLKRRGLDCLYPEVPRAHVKSVKSKDHIHAEGVHHELTALGRLDKLSYRTLISDLLSQAEVVDHSADPCKDGFIPGGDKLLALYYFQRDASDMDQVAALVACLWDGGPVSGLFEGVLRTSFHGNQVLLVGSCSEFSKQFIPKSLHPIEIAKYKDR